jgi:hypothetical protein
MSTGTATRLSDGFCQHCGKHVQQDADFCSSCGMRILPPPDFMLGGPIGQTWISRLEQAEKQKTEEMTRRDAQVEVALRIRSEQFAAVIEILRPLIEKQVVQVSQRLRIELTFCIERAEIWVYAPEPKRGFGFNRLTKFPFWFELSYAAVDAIRVKAVVDGRVDRPGEPPDDMTIGDYYGTKDEIISVEATLNELVGGDLDLLIEWLVVCHRTGQGQDVPRLRAIVRRERAKKISRAARFCLAFSILGFFVPLFWPPSFVGSILIGLRLKKTGQKEGRAVVAWSIGIGVLPVISLIILLLIHLRRRI